jgi:hypothetical protein
LFLDVIPTLDARHGLIDKTSSGLWPSDHAGLAARLRFDR